MRMVQDDVISFMKSVAEGSLAGEDHPDFLDDLESFQETYETGRQDGFTELARKLLQMMGVSYDASQ